MPRIKGWLEPIAFNKRHPEEVGEFAPPFLYLPVTHKTLPFLRGAGTAWMQRKSWTGTEEEITGAIEAMARQLGADAIMPTWVEQVEFRITEAGILEWRALIDGVWGEWEPLGDVTGEAGPAGPEGPEGPQGWVHVGFYLMGIQNTEDPAIAEITRQWYCRDGAESNTFYPEGPLEVIGTIELNPGPQGEQGETGAPGPYYEITSTNPVPSVAYFWRQLKIWNGTEYISYGENAQFGGVIAPAGPQGEQGEPGPPGATGPAGPQGPQGEPGASGAVTAVVPTEDNSEFQRLSYLARRLVDESIDKALFHWAGVAWIMDLALGASVFRRMNLDQPTGSLPTAFTIWANSEAGRNAAAEQVYCALIPYRDLSLSSINSYIATYEAHDWLADFTAGDYHLMLNAWISNDMAYDPKGAQRDMGIILNNYSYNPDWDYTSLPCTPDLGDIQLVYDFVEGDEQGWESSSSLDVSNSMVHFPAEGLGRGGTSVFGAKLVFEEPQDIETVEYMYNYPSGSGNLSPRFGFMPAGTSTWSLDGGLGGFGQNTLTRTNVGLVDAIAIFGVDSGTFRLQRVSLTMNE